MPASPPAEFVRKARELNIAFEPGDLDLLGEYLSRLLAANTQFNLTAIKDPDEAWVRHILDSLTLVPFIASEIEGVNETAPKRVIDIGSGGGLPGIPLAIVFRDDPIRFTLLEATGKKARFLNDVIQELNLTKADVLTERAEVAGQDHKSHREMYDLVLARAVGRLPTLLELTVPFAKVGGHVIAMKGEKAAEEIEEARTGRGGGAMHLLHCRVVDTCQTGTGSLVVIEKSRKTPRAYPRKPGEPKRAPLA